MGRDDGRVELHLPGQRAARGQGLRADDHVRPRAAGGVEPPVLRVPVLRLEAQEVVVRRGLPDADLGAACAPEDLFLRGRSLFTRSSAFPFASCCFLRGWPALRHT